jgi:HK97 family phage prohead protease
LEVSRQKSSSQHQTAARIGFIGFNKNDRRTYMKTQTKSRLRMEIKEITAEGTFEGLLSPYGNVDGGLDVVEPGAYTKTIKDHGAKVPLLWQHKADMPIGELTLDDRKDGLWCKGQLLMELPEAQKAHLLIKATIVKGLSIGFESVKDAIEGGIRRLKEIRLYEGSIVTFPMNEAALITSVKAKRERNEKGDFIEEFEEIQTLNSLSDMQTALADALRSVIWSDMERDDKVAAGETIVQQFADSFSAIFPNYIDVLVELYGPMEAWAAKRTEIKERSIKAGAEFSASNIEKLKGVRDAILTAHDSLSTLLEGKAGASTLQTKAAETKSEPEPEDHSAAEVVEIMSGIRSLIPA